MVLILLWKIEAKIILDMQIILIIVVHIACMVWVWDYMNFFVYYNDTIAGAITYTVNLFGDAYSSGSLDGQMGWIGWKKNIL